MKENMWTLRNSVKCIHLDETDSTNQWLKEHAAEETSEILVVADYQTAGRGQTGNHWESEYGKNLLYSLLLHPTGIQASQQFLISMIISLAVCKALQSYTSGITIKWPNDIYWKDRKICGMLIENRISGQIIKDCIAGIGININQRVFHSDAPNPVSLCQILGKEVSQQHVLDRFLSVYKKLMRYIESCKTDDIRTAYINELYRREGYHRYCDDNGSFEAKLVTVSDNGTLHLEDRNGKQRSYAFKEVTFLT